MKLIIDLSIVCDEPGNTHVYATVRKEYDTDLVPMARMQLEDLAWKESRPIRSVTINPEEGYYFVYAGEDTCQDEGRCEQLEQMYHSHGWKRPGL